MVSNLISLFSSSATDTWTELIGDNDLLDRQYDIIAGRLPQDKSEVVLIVDKNNEVNELIMYALGLKDQNEFMTDMLKVIAEGSELQTTSLEAISYEDVLNMDFRLVLNYQYFEKDGSTGLWADHRDNALYVRNLAKNAMQLKIVGILRPDPSNVLSTGTGTIGYTTELMEYALAATADSEPVKAQLANTAVDVTTGAEYNTMTVNDFDLADIDLTLIDYTKLNLAPFMSMLKDIDLSQIDILHFDITDLMDFSDMTALQKKIMEGFLTDEQVLAFKQAYLDTINENGTLESTLSSLGYSTEDTPTSIYIYPKSFKDKDEINAMVAQYNEKMEEQGYKGYTVTVTDYVGMLMSSVTNVLKIVTCVLVAFVAISLVVSSVMIGIITYTSVLERTKEIGILRSIGASKKDIASVFNAETVTIGLGAGIIGILVSLLLEIPINIALKYFTQTGAAAQLPFIAAVILVCISVFLTFIAGLVPSSMAAKKDPVEALRTE